MSLKPFSKYGELPAIESTFHNAYLDSDTFLHK